MAGAGSEAAFPESLKGFLPLFSCPVCRQGGLGPEGERLACDACGHIFPTVRNIPDLRPAEPLRRPRVYDDPDYGTWVAGLAEAQDYFYREGGIVNFIQGSGHRAVRRLREGRAFGITLDLGCGDGAHYPFLHRPGACLGIDIDQRSLEKLKTRYPAFAVVRADAYSLPLRDQTVDSIISVYNLEHMAYLDLTFEEMHRVLQEKGHLFVSVPNEGGFCWGMGRRMSTARRFSTPTLDYRRAIQIDHINCVWQIEKAIRRYFRIIRRVFFPLRIPVFHLNLVTTYWARKRAA
jgi:SAM-dependent methyltransferase